MLIQFFLSLISVLDSYGAQTWNLRLVAAASAVLLYGTYKLGRRSGQGAAAGGGSQKVGDVCWE
eukprot:CAMPEP_0197731958 /NCGR_PEP_ID=MMETSP1434-20131217/39163_1 /TAXON_ID=265543 /ORGANISM="Minutocellus polymorphus, Strain CCMP3303" /LENGTH=63 /DNA_ID=CAMNT_0043319057 /DNA_START=33 /DNA_END=221 /DNA_ORIENTATION=-